MHNPYWHECSDCGIELNELDTNLQGKPVLIYDDGGWFCRECWKRMDAEREAKYTESAA